MLSDGSYESYVRSLMEKLRRSGYLYHPKLQFATMMAVFRLKPELIKKSLGSIYDAVMQWRLETWTVEPFRSAFVEQFEIYVADARRRIDELPQPETDADFGNLENVITAIALQLHIADSRSFEAYSVNRSRLYRYASLARPRSGDALLDKALYTLLNGGGKHLEFSYDSIKNYTMMVTAMSTPMHDAQRQIDTPRVLNSGHVRVELSADGLTLRRTDEAPGADQVLPNNSIPWLTPRVYLDGVPQLSRAKLNTAGRTYGSGTRPASAGRRGRRGGDNHHRLRARPLQRQQESQALLPYRRRELRGRRGLHGALRHSGLQDTGYRAGGI